MLAGTEQPPAEWLNNRLAQLGETWTVSAAAKPHEAPITKTDSFATLVPIVPAWTNGPIPMNNNVQDPHHDYYRDLSMLAGRPDKPPEGSPPYTNRGLEADNGVAFSVRLIQYYIFRATYSLQRGSSGGIKWTKGVGVTPIQRLPIPPPDATPYPDEQVFQMLSGNEFFGPMDKMLWNNDYSRWAVPKGSRISFIERPAVPEKGQVFVCTVRFERPKYYRLDFDASIGLATNNLMPAGYDPPEVPGVFTWTVPVTMRYEIERPTDENLDPRAYAAWADALFTGLRQRMAF